MRKIFNLQIVLILLLLFTASMGIARDYIIYSISQDIPMGTQNEIIKKNYYINIGNAQGVQRDTILDVFRTISRIDPYKNKQRYNYEIKIGELKVLHAETEAAIARLENLNNGIDTPVYDIDGLMIGDKVNIKVK